MLIPVPAASVHKALEQAAESARRHKLVNAAHEFEAQLMKEILKPLMSGDGEEGAGGVLGEFAGEALGRGISDRGGLGIADRMIAQLGSKPEQADGAKPMGDRGNQ
jgi:Rod binding domain-containing protein